MENKILKIDLSDRSHETEEIPDKVIRQYLGGRGLGAYLLYKSVPPGADPLGKDNHLIFSAGPANGTGMPYSPKSVVTTKSPLTNIYLYAVSSGIFSHQMRKAGFWAVDISGVSDSPVYIAINNDEVSFHDASPLWGMESAGTQSSMLGDLSPKDAATLAIGPSGEKLVRYASIMTDGPTYRAFGRGGSGAVMGSKRLKGIVVAGSAKIEPADRAGFNAIKKAIVNNIKAHKDWVEHRRDYGTGGHTFQLSELGVLPTRNWAGGQFGGAAKICTFQNKDEWPLKNIPCAPFCPTPCSHLAEIGRGPYQGAHTDGPEYETIYAFGSNCGVDKFDAIVAAGQICDEYGLDTMSAGVAIGFAMECFEKGLIGLDDTDGIELRFGSDEAMLAVLKKLARQEGFGQRLAEGVKRLSAEIGGSEQFAMHTKGLELGGYECRGLMGEALEFAINNRGGCHHGYGIPALVEIYDGSRMKTEGKGELVKNLAVHTILRDSLAVCMFPRLILTNAMITDVVSSLFGRAWSPDDLIKVGTRIMCQERLFNMREGITRDDDSLPPRLLNEAKPDGPTQGVTVPLEELKNNYYQAMGWDLSTGNPPDSLLNDLEIER
jgi:aldehyde:ferredoxin oxidoreductase